MSRKDMEKILKEDGWYQVKANTGHKQYKHPTKKGKVTVPDKINQNIKLSILRQAGLR